MEPKYQYIYGNGKDFIKEVFTLEQIENQEPFEVLSPSLKDYKLIARRIGTGLIDKNKNEIFKDDIVVIKNTQDIKTKEIRSHTFKIIWNKCTFAYDSEDWYMPLSDYNLDTLEPYIIEIIGNIHTTPNLLIK